MAKRTRLIILLICTILFFVIAPYIVLYSLGYRVNFRTLKIVATGGIYIKVLPQEATIAIDSDTQTNTGIFSNSVFFQNLLPGQHSILIKKDGYYDYQKNLEVKEKKVTKLEHVILFKKDISFKIVQNKTRFPFNRQIPEDVYIIKNNNLYYSDVQENNTLSKIQKNTPVAKNILAYKLLNGNIIWLALDGFLYNSDITGTAPSKINSQIFPIKKNNSYKIIANSRTILLKENDAVFLFNKNSGIFENLYNLAKDIKFSPDDQKILYYNDHEILYSYSNNIQDKIFLNRFSEKINDLYWLNNEHVIFKLGNKIFISEIDNRGNVNTFSLPQNLPLAGGGVINAKDAKIFFNQQDKKLYILAEKNLFSSEKLVP